MFCYRKKKGNRVCPCCCSWFWNDILRLFICDYQSAGQKPIGGDLLPIFSSGVGHNMLSSKMPSCILFNSDQRVHSIGFEAQEKYTSLAEDNEHEDWYYFSRFKMMLYEPKVSNVLSRPKSVRNRCVIELFVALFVLSLCPFDISVGVGAFVIGLSQISSFFSQWLTFRSSYLVVIRINQEI